MLLLAFEVGEILGGAATTFVIGFSVVFMVLLLLTGVFKVFGLIMSLKEKKMNERTPDTMIPVAPAAPVASAAAPVVGNTETVSSQPDVDGGIPAETVAAISAAVASVAPEGTQYAVKGIKKL